VKIAPAPWDSLRVREVPPAFIRENTKLERRCVGKIDSSLERVF
jgi:hypothetical protein